MFRFPHSKFLSLPTLWVSIVFGMAVSLPAQGAGSWSTPVQPPAGCLSPSGATPSNSLAVNSAGEMALAGYTQTGSIFTVQVCTSSDGVSWSGPITIGQGVAPAVALATDGRIVVIWQWVSGVATNIQASVRPPGGTWSAPVIVSPNSGHPVVGMDASGNAVAAWAPVTLTQPVEAASLPAGGNWTAVQTLAAQGGGVNMAVNSVGGAIVTWRSAGLIEAASGTIFGGFGTPVNLGFIYGVPGVRTAPRVALNDAGEASLVWNSHDSNRVVTRAADGTWSTSTSLSIQPAGVRTAIDGEGNAIAVFSETLTTGTPTYASLRPAGGTWGSPTLLSSLNDSGVGDVVVDAYGTFVATWISSTGTVEALTIPPGGGFSPGAAIGTGPFNSLKIVPGHAVLWIGAGISSETVP